MFVLTETYKAVQGDDNPYLGLIIFICLVVIIIFAIVMGVRYRKWEREFDEKFRDK
jgi:uncharacterized membrane protein YjgN (DUF898 family)